MVCQNLLTVVTPRCLDGTMAEYMGKLHDFTELLSLAYTLSQELEQRSKFFMLLGLHGLFDDYFHVHDQILGSPFVPNSTSTFSTLLCVLGKHTTDTHTPVDFSFALVSQRNDCTDPHMLSKACHKIVVILVTKLIGVMPYMVILLDM